MGVRSETHGCLSLCWLRADVNTARAMHELEAGFVAAGIRGIIVSVAKRSALSFSILPPQICCNSLYWSLYIAGFRALASLCHCIGMTADGGALTLCFDGDSQRLTQLSTIKP